MRNGRIIKYAARLLLAVVIGLVMLGSLPAPVQADEDLDLINLELGGEGATSWNIESILPCSSGTKTVELHNAGSEDGFVAIWISDIDSGEGLNPEPETNTTGEGELDDYLLLNLRTDPDGRLDTDISLPATINDFPPSIDGPGHIWIIPLNAGETVTLYWDWELPCETGNDAQGDTLSFTITYYLEELPPPPPPPPPPGGGGFGPETCYLTIDMLGERTTVEMDCCLNTTLEECKAYDEEEVHLLELQYDNLVLCEDCEGCNCYPRIIVMSLSEETPELPEGMAVVGSIYDFTGYRDSLRQIPCPLRTYFDPVASVLLSYDPALLPPDATNPVIGFYSHDLGQWVILPPVPGVVAEVGVATGLAEYFASPFAVLVNVLPPPPTTPEPPAPAPAHFVASGLNITPSVREIWQPVTFVTKTGESVTISLNVANDGEQAGTYIVELKINGQTIDSQVVTLGAGQSEQVSFTLSGMEAGQYEVAVSGLSGEFTVLRTINWWLIGIIIAVLIILSGWLVWHFLYRKSWFRIRRIKPKPAS
ncbi:hypothetical protein ES703_08559 [subsurface metagenome]